MPRADLISKLAKNRVEQPNRAFLTQAIDRATLVSVFKRGCGCGPSPDLLFQVLLGFDKLRTSISLGEYGLALFDPGARQARFQLLVLDLSCNPTKALLLGVGAGLVPCLIGTGVG